MDTNERRNKHCVSLYKIQSNSKQNSIDICIIDVQIMNVLRYNNQLDIWNFDKTS